MDLQQIYVKTSKGQTEVQKRIYKLPASLRKVLIMVDGHSSAGEMLERLSAMGDISGALLELEASGFIAGLLPHVESHTPSTASATNSAVPAANVDNDDPKSERLLLQNIWDSDDAAYLSASAPQVKSAAAAFQLAKAKGFVRSTLLAALGPAAARRIERVEATTTVEELRVELDGIREMLPTVLSKRQAEQVWRQLEPLMLPLSSAPATPASPAQALSALQRAQQTLRQTLTKHPAPNTEYWMQRLTSASSVEVLQIELDVFIAMLPRIFSRQQAAQVNAELAPLLATLVAAPSAETFNLNKARDVVRYTLLAAMGATAARRIERIDTISELGEFAKELEAIREMLPKVLSKRDAEQAWKQLLPVLESLQAVLE